MNLQATVFGRVSRFVDSVRETPDSIFVASQELVQVMVLVAPAAEPDGRASEVDDLHVELGRGPCAGNPFYSEVARALVDLLQESGCSSTAEVCRLKEYLELGNERSRRPGGITLSSGLVGAKIHVGVGCSDPDEAHVLASMIAPLVELELVKNRRPANMLTALSHEISSQPDYTTVG